MFLDYFKLAYQEIKNNKLEVSLTVLGIVVGIASVTLILSIGEGAVNMVKSKMATYQEDVLLISYSPDGRKSQNSMSAMSGGDGNPLAGFMSMIMSAQKGARAKKEGDWPLPFNSDQALQEIANCPIVDSVAYFGRRQSDTDLFHKEKFPLMLTFTDNTFSHYVKENVSKGRNMTDWEITSRKAVGLLKLPRKDYDWLIQYGGIIGQEIYVENRAFTVIGLISTSSQKAEFYIPYTWWEELATIDELPQFLIKFKAGGDVASKKPKLFSWLKSFVHNGDYYQEDSDLNIYQQFLIYLPKFTMMMSFIAGISLVVGGIGIMNSMLSSVMKRTKEIGIRKSIGAKSYSMITQFIIESLLIAVIGGLFGIALGVLLSTITLYFFKIPPVFPVMSVVYCVSLTLVIGVGSGVFPAIKAANMDPIAALGHS